MTDRIAEIRERASRATEGPWERDTVSQNSERECHNVITDPAGKSICDSLNASRLCLSYESDGEGAGDWSDVGTLHDFEFISHARDDIPYLLAQLDAARAEVERLRAVVRRSAHSFNALELGRGVTVSRRAGKKWVVYYNSVSINDPPVRHEEVMDAINEALSFTPPVSPGDAPDCAKCGTTMVRSRDEHVCVNCGHKEKP